MEAPLARNISYRSQTSTHPAPTRQDGHIEGNLNCIALRHGWSRSFSITPEQVSTLDYITLEVLLELPTLKLRSASLRIFVENPAGSGTYSKVRFWKDDASLQSVLVKQFFEKRLAEGGTTVLDIRDGHDRDDSAKEWYKRSRGMNRSTTSVGTTGTVLDDDDVPMTPGAGGKSSRMKALMYAIGVSSQPPTVPKAQAQGVETVQNEEEQLKKRGWMAPIVRRMTSSSKSSPVRRRMKRNDSSTHLNPATAGEEINVDELQVDQAPQAEPAPAPQKSTKWFRFLGGDNEKQVENPFVGSKENLNEGVSESTAKGQKAKGKRQQQDAEMAKRPADVFDSLNVSSNNREEID